jgi:transposase
MQKTKKVKTLKWDFKVLFGAEGRLRLLIKHGGNISYSNSHRCLCIAPLDRSTCYINIRTAQRYVKKYNDDEEKRLPVRCSKPTAGCIGKLTEEHSKFLVEYVDEHPAAVFSDIRHHLCKAFFGLTISISALHRHLVQKWKVTLKKLEKLTTTRNSDQVVVLRKEKIEEWNAIPCLDFCKNCVFIDEARFNLHT